MIKELKILSSPAPNVFEGCMKLDEKYLTVTFKGIEGSYYFIYGNELTPLSSNRQRLVLDKMPANACIFLKKEDGLCPVLYTGDVSRFNNAVKAHSFSVIPFENEKAQPSPEPQPEALEPIISKPESIEEPAFFERKKAPETYFECNSASFIKLLDESEPFDEMSHLIPGSRWVKPENEDYVFGVIYSEEGDPLYLCYGFDLPFADDPPKALEGYCQWIPVSCDDPRGRGFWVIYQDAVTGERIK